MNIHPTKIMENPKNEVYESKLFKKRKAYDKETGRWNFSDGGIFSEKVFGKFNTCYCGKVTKPGYCPDCGCRVISKKNIPNFYIKFNFDLPNYVINYGLGSKINKDIVEPLLYYKGFLYEGQYYEYDVLTTDTRVFNPNKVLIGKDAILSLGITPEWYNSNVHRLINIPHTSFRPALMQGNEIRIGRLNQLYADMLRLKEHYDLVADDGLINVFNELNLKYTICEYLAETNYELFLVLAKNNNNIVDKELKGQPETGMIRAVMTNNFGLQEDTLLIGNYFISTLYPRLYNKYTNLVTKVTDIDALNQELKNEEYLVLFNRQPTIGAKSIIAMKPVFSKNDDEAFVIQANPIVYDGLAADVDGDALNVIALYTKEANQEAKRLLASKNYLEGSNSGIRNGIIEEFEYIENI